MSVSPMFTKDQKLERKAKRMALEYLNKNRACHPALMKPLKSISNGWWMAYGEEWITKAKEQK